jgi:hypothetical protein
VERRLAITYLVSATTTLGIGSIAIAAASGSRFAGAYASGVGVKRVEMIDEYIVVHSQTTTTIVVDAATVPPDPATELARQSAILRSKTPRTTVAASAPVVEPAAVPEAAPTGTPPPTRAAEPPEAEPPEAEDPAPPATTAAAPTTTPIVRPPNPEGCREPELQHGAWECDDD